ncbi:uncharacterized protein LOC141899333 [Tubulanus polymorphus]|uniref:uncharacterized protein LOC141899333 n=1 Tax=Tubulanus polymorphus TaxID=672921 RepID=UPI003DA43C43
MDQKPDHRKLQRQCSSNVESMRRRWRDERSDLRKEQRDKILLSKRVRHQSYELNNDDDEFTELQIKEMTKQLLHTSPSSEKKEILKVLRKAFGRGTLYIDAFLSVPNSMECMVGILTGLDTELHLESAWCLTNISAGMHEHAKITLKMAAPYLITYLSGSNPVMQDQCAWALGNIAGDSEECRDVLKHQGIIPPLVELLKSPSPTVVKSALFAISNMARGHDPSIKEMLNIGVATLVLNLMEFKEDMLPVIAEVAWVLTYLTASGDYEEELVSQGIIPKISNMIAQIAVHNHDDVQAITPLLRALGNLCSGADRYSVDASQTDGLLPALSKFLQSNHRHIRKECLWTMSNMTGEMNVAREIIRTGAVPHFVNLLSAAYDIKKEAAYCICNLVCHGDEFCQFISHSDAIVSMIPLLKVSGNDVELIHLALCFYEAMFRAVDETKHRFEESGGVGYLEGLEYHANDTIRSQANDLLDKHFWIDDEREEDDDTLEDVLTAKPMVTSGPAE